jgi:hypothetical protein
LGLVDGREEIIDRRCDATKVTDSKWLWLPELFKVCQLNVENFARATSVHARTQVFEAEVDNPDSRRLAACWYYTASEVDFDDGETDDDDEDEDEDVEDDKVVDKNKSDKKVTASPQSAVNTQQSMTAASSANGKKVSFGAAPATVEHASDDDDDEEYEPGDDEDSEDIDDDDDGDDDDDDEEEDNEHDEFAGFGMLVCV